MPKPQSIVQPLPVWLGRVLTVHLVYIVFCLTLAYRSPFLGRLRRTPRAAAAASAAARKGQLRTAHVPRPLRRRLHSPPTPIPPWPRLKNSAPRRRAAPRTTKLRREKKEAKPSRHQLCAPVSLPRTALHPGAHCTGCNGCLAPNHPPPLSHMYWFWCVLLSTQCAVHAKQYLLASACLFAFYRSWVGCSLWLWCFGVSCLFFFF